MGSCSREEPRGISRQPMEASMSYSQVGSTIDSIGRTNEVPSLGLAMDRMLISSYKGECESSSMHPQSHFLQLRRGCFFFGRLINHYKTLTLNRALIFCWIFYLFIFK
jgi:hypothetical protein